MGRRRDPEALRGAAPRERPRVALPRGERRARTCPPRARRRSRSGDAPIPPARLEPGAAVRAGRTDPRVSAPTRICRAGARRAPRAPGVAAARGADPRHRRRSDSSRSRWPGASSSGSTSGPPPSRRSRGLVGDPGLLRAAAARSTASTRSRCSSWHRTSTRPSAPVPLYLISLARCGDLEPGSGTGSTSSSRPCSQRARAADLTGLDARNLVEQRRAEAMRLVADAPGSADRIEHAPRAYLLARARTAVARQVRLLDHFRRRNEAGSRCTPIESDDVAEIDVASRDRPALLAHVSGVLVDYGLDVSARRSRPGATAPRWRASSVRGPRASPTARSREARRAHAAGSRSSSRWRSSRVASTGRSPAPPNPDAEVSFDDAGSPWYTLCEVRSPDRRGLLHTSPRRSPPPAPVCTRRDSRRSTAPAVDRFELTDRNESQARRRDEGRRARRRSATGWPSSVGGSGVRH